MNIDLLKLKLNQEQKIQIDNTIIIDNDYLKNTDIKNISEVKISGKILYHGEDVFELILNIKCDLTMECSISLQDVLVPVNIDVNETLGYDVENENNKIINNTIDLIPIIWQNIILEVPLKVVSPNVDRSKLNGDGWRLVTSEEELKENEIEEKLKDFFDNKERS